MLRKIYRRLVPIFVRRALWGGYWLIISLRKDYAPQSYLFESDNYDQYWNDRLLASGGDRISYGELIELCLAEIPDNARIIDFGCGAGHLLADIARRRRIDGIGLDISARAVEIARENGVNAQQFEVTAQGDLVQLGHFDVAIATEVLEHIASAELIMLALACVADRVLVSIPNTGYLHYRLRLLAGRFPRQWIQHPAEHLRYWTKADFEFNAKLAGFKVQRVSGVGGGKLGQLFPALFAPSLFFVLSSPSVSPKD